MSNPLDLLGNIQRQIDRLSGADVQRQIDRLSGADVQRQVGALDIRREMGAIAAVDHMADPRAVVALQRAVDSLLRERPWGTRDEGPAPDVPDETSKAEDDSDSEESGLVRLELVKQFQPYNFVQLRVFEAIRRDPRLMHGLSPRDFELFIAELFARLGYEEVHVTPPSNDGGFDVFATQRRGGSAAILGIDCKRYAESNKITLQMVRTITGAMVLSDQPVNIGVLVTTSSFTRGAKGVFAGKKFVRGQDYNDLVRAIQKCASRGLEG